MTNSDVIENVESEESGTKSATYNKIIGALLSVATVVVIGIGGYIFKQQVDIQKENVGLKMRVGELQKDLEGIQRIDDAQWEAFRENKTMTNDLHVNFWTYIRLFSMLLDQQKIKVDSVTFDTKFDSRVPTIDSIKREYLKRVPKEPDYRQSVPDAKGEK